MLIGEKIIPLSLLELSARLAYTNFPSCVKETGQSIWFWQVARSFRLDFTLSTNYMPFYPAGLLICEL